MTEPNVELDLLKAPDRRSRVVFRDLIVRPEDDDFIVGRVESAQFVALPSEGVRAIELLRSGATINDVEANLSTELGVELDVLEFVSSLVDLGFVAAIDDLPIETSEQSGALAWLRASHLGWLESPIVRLVYLAIVLLGAAALIADHGLFPRYRDFFWSGSPGLVVVGNTAVFVVYLACHELAHLVAARSLGVPAQITFGTRLHNLVVQTDVSGLWAVPRGQRYRVYLAGMVWDLVPLSASLAILAFADPTSHVAAALRAADLLICLALVQQFQFFMRTDLYFVFLDLTRSRNLFEDASVQLAASGRRFFAIIRRRSLVAGAVDPFAALPPRRRWLIKSYAFFIFIGSATALLVFAVFTLPIAIQLFTRAWHSLTYGLSSHNETRALDGAATIVVEGALQIAFLVVFVRSRRDWFGALRSRLQGAT